MYFFLSPPHLLYFLFFITSIGFNLFCVKKTNKTNTPFFFLPLFLSVSSLAFLYVGSIRVDILLSVSVLSLAFFFFFVVELEIPTLIGLLNSSLLKIYYLFGCGSFSHTLLFTYIYKYIYNARNTKKRDKCPTTKTATSRARSSERDENLNFLS